MSLTWWRGIWALTAFPTAFPGVSARRSWSRSRAGGSHAGTQEVTVSQERQTVASSMRFLGKQYKYNLYFTDEETFDLRFLSQALTCEMIFWELKSQHYATVQAPSQKQWDPIIPRRIEKKKIYEKNITQKKFSSVGVFQVGISA